LFEAGRRGAGAKRRVFAQGRSDARGLHSDAGGLGQARSRGRAAEAVAERPRE